MKIIECVPNFSEGRDQKKILSLAGVFKSFPGVRLADFSGDADHNRSVFTFLGKPEDVLEAALASCSKALELIDMTKQKGVHPRLGAVDVVPFIPLGRTKMKDAVDLAHAFGQEFHKRFDVPVYFYGFASLNDKRVELPDVRRGGYETLEDKITRVEDAPDVGAVKFNARSGATVVGAREILVAYNINLDSDNLFLARHIASRIREKGGGLKHVRAIGVMLKEHGLAQVSMNLTNCKETPLKIVFDRVNELAAEGGVKILESELIGLVPQCALAGTSPEYLKLKYFDEHRLLETHIKALEK
jgi:glutamate formiminotransferase